MTVEIDYEITENSWGQYLHQDFPVHGYVERVGVMLDGTVNGKPALELLICLERSGVRVVAQVPLNEMVSVVSALGARHAQQMS